MPSLRGIIRNAVDRKQVPPHQAGSTRDLALKLGMRVPISVQGLVATMAGLPLATVIFNSGELGPDTVSGFGWVGIRSDGAASIRVHAHESGAIGHNFVLAMALSDVVDSQGKMLSFAIEGAVHGTFDPRDRDEDKQTDGGPNPVISDQWNAIKNSRVESRLHVSTDAFQALEAVVTGGFAALLTAAGAVGVALFVGDPQTKCTWATDGAGQPGVTWAGPTGGTEPGD
jgi:hypothetical protein